MLASLSAAAAVAVISCCVDAVGPPGYLLPSPKAASSSSGNGLFQRIDDPVIEATFEQLLDHNNPDLGTFTQRYWYNSQFYDGPGSPVVLYAPGEYDGDNVVGYITEIALPGVFARTNGGAALLLEHRYWGRSSPYKDLTAETLQYLTLNQTIQDIIYFAQNVKLPFDPEGTSKPEKAPWVLSGCSYPGALASWIHNIAPGTFWAYHSSSAPVQAAADFWQFFEPIDKALPRNCSTDMKKIHRHVEKVLNTEKEGDREGLKDSFGLGGMEDDDFAMAIVARLVAWQDQQFYSGYGNVFELCDWIEGFHPGNENPVAPGPEGVGLEKSLEAFAKWWKDHYLPGPGACPPMNADSGDYPPWSCYDSHNASYPVFTDIAVDNAFNRQWMWLLCNEALEFWPVGSSHSTVGYPASVANTDYFRRQCSLFFPKTNGHEVGIVNGKHAKNVNDLTGGWNSVDTTRLMWSNGEYDPWRSLSVASDFRPGGPFRGDDERPSYVIPGASHCNDIMVKNAMANPGVKKVMDAEVAKMKEWIGAWYELKRA